MSEDQIPTTGPVAGTAAEPAATLLSPAGYELCDEIGHGGMGVVYRARDTALDRNVAVKLLSERYPADSPAAQRFLSEARITGQLQHPGIPAVHQVGTLADGRPFLAMKLIKGSTLEAILKQRSDPSAERGRLLGIFEMVCQAVGYAHAHRVIHRDLKPANVMVGTFGEVQVMDWGLAKVLGKDSLATEEALATEHTQAWTQVTPTPEAGAHTQAGSLIGTPAFISPEQAMGEIEKINERSDVFGLGALLAVILTGKPPYVGDTSESVRVQSGRGKLEGCFARLDASGAEPELLALCKKCLAFEPADRLANAGAVATAVAAFRAAADERARRAELERVRLEGEQATAQARAAERRKRQRLVIGAAAVLMVAAAGGLTAVLAVQRQANADLAAKNDDLRRANAGEAEASRQAQANFEMANQAVEDYLFNVADDDRLKERDLSELRKKLVASAATFYRKFTTAQKEGPQLELMLGRAYYNLGRLHIELTEVADAIEKLRQAQAIFQHLRKRDPDNPEHRYYLGLAGLELGSFLLYSQKRLAEAEKELDKALPLLEQLARQHPAVKKYRSKETLGVMERSLLLERRGHMDRAEVLCRRAVELQRQIVVDFPETEEQHYLSRYLGSLGFMLRHLNRQKDASQCLQEAIRINKDVVRAAPRVSRYRATTGWLSQELFWNLRDLGDPKGADEAIRKAVEVDRELVAEFPSVPSYQGTLVFDMQYLVERLTDTGRATEAVPLGQEAIRVGEKLVADYPKEPQFRQYLAAIYFSQARALHRGGQIGEGEKHRRRSIELYEGLCKESPDSPKYRENLGVSRVGLAYVLAATKRFPEAKVEGARALAVFEKLAKEHSSVAEYKFHVAFTCLNLAGVLAVLGEPNEEVIKKGIAALGPLVEKRKNARYERILAALKEEPAFSAPHPPVKVPSDVSDVASIPATIKGELTENVPLDQAFPLTQKSYHKVHHVELTAGKHYQIDLTGDFDTFLRLEDQKQARLLCNDDVTPPDNVNSRLIYSPKQTAVYRLIVTSVKPGITGAYTLKVQEAVPAGPPQKIEGKLTEGDQKLNGRYRKQKKIELRAGLAHVIEAQSADYDIRIGLGDAAGGKPLSRAILINTPQKQISRVDYTPGQTGPSVLFLTTAQPGQIGPYAVQVQAYKVVP